MAQRPVQSAPHRTITIVEEVEKCEKDALEALLSTPEGGSATIIINSGGGSVYASLGIATMIRARRLVCHGVVLADCSSSALIIFAACATREVAEHASFLFHPMQWASEERTRLTGARSWSAEFQRVNQVCEDFLVEHLPIERPLLRRWVSAERYVPAVELIEMGIARSLQLPEPKVVSVGSRRRRTQTPARRPLRRAG